MPNPGRSGEAHQTGKVTFVTAKAQCYHWWQCHASKSQWDLLDDLWEFDISHEEMLMALGIDLKACPLPVGTAIDLIPMILPSHEVGHDPRIAEAPWCRKIAYASQPSEWGVPWAGNTFRKSPRPPSYPPPSYMCKEQSTKDYPQSAATSGATNPSQDYPQSGHQMKQQSKQDPKKEHENLMTNRNIVRELSEAGVPQMPGADYYSEGVLTSLGWFDPLEVFYDQMVGELREICSGHSSVGDYGSVRSKHACGGIRKIRCGSNTAPHGRACILRGGHEADCHSSDVAT